MLRFRKGSEEQFQLLPFVLDIRSDHPTLSVREMYFMLQPEWLGRDAFEQLCREWDLTVKKAHNYRRTTDSSGVIRFDNLIQNINLTGIDQVWQSDITYFEINKKFYYLTFIIDAYSRRILGHSVSYRLLTSHTTLPALEMAIQCRSNKKLPGLIFHSDGGGQYYADQFLQLTKQYQITNSMCEFPWQNGKAERINGVIKNNYLIHRVINNFEDLVKEVDRSVTLYNTKKPHSRLYRMTPVAFENELIILQAVNSGKLSHTLATAAVYHN